MSYCFTTPAQLCFWLVGFVGCVLHAWLKLLTHASDQLSSCAGKQTDLFSLSSVSCRAHSGVVLHCQVSPGCTDLVCKVIMQINCMWTLNIAASHFCIPLVWKGFKPPLYQLKIKNHQREITVSSLSRRPLPDCNVVTTLGLLHLVFFSTEENYLLISIQTCKMKNSLHTAR